MKKTVFVVEVVTNDKDGCGEDIRPPTVGEVRRALLKGLEQYESVQVVNSWETA